MATIKHISSKNADYSAAEKYLMFEHDEHTQKVKTDSSGRLIPREDIRFTTIGCREDDYAVACIRAHRQYGKTTHRRISNRITISSVLIRVTVTITD